MYWLYKSHHLQRGKGVVCKCDSQSAASAAVAPLVSEEQMRHLLQFSSREGLPPCLWQLAPVSLCEELLKQTPSDAHEHYIIII